MTPSQRKEVQAGSQMLWAALVASLLTLLALWSPLFGLFALVSFAAGLAGVSRVGRGIEAGAAARYAGMVAAALPVLGLLPQAWFLYRGRVALATPEDPHQTILVTDDMSPSRPRPRPRPRPTTPAPASIHRAVAYVKLAGLNARDGDRLQAQVRSPGGNLPADQEPVLRVSKGVFAVAYVKDQGDSLGYVNMGELQAAGLSLDELHRVGLRNLGALLDKAGAGLTLKPVGKAYGLLMGGNFEASLVLLDELWDGLLAEYIPNGAVVALPAKDICAFCDAASAEGIAELKAISARVLAGSGQAPLSPRLLLRRHGQWQRFQEPAMAATPPGAPLQ